MPFLFPNHYYDHSQLGWTVEGMDLKIVLPDYARRTKEQETRGLLTVMQCSAAECCKEVAQKSSKSLRLGTGWTRYVGSSSGRRQALFTEFVYP